MFWPFVYIQGSTNSYYLGEQKMDSFERWSHRLSKSLLNEIYKHKELNTVTKIAKHNGYKKEQ
jgi:hypothetical protein